MIFFNTNLEREREGLRGMIFLNTNLEREREGLSRLQDANQACGHSKKVRRVLTCERSLA